MITPFLVLIVTCVCMWLYLCNNLKERNKHPELKSRWDSDIWGVLRLIFVHLQWTFDKSNTKRPFLEHLNSDIRNKHCLQRLSNIFKVNLVINDDYESVKNSLHDGKSVKMSTALNEILSRGTNRGILWNDGPLWKELRRYTLRKLAQLGFGKTDNLSLTLSEILPELFKHLDSLKDTTGNKIPIKNIFNLHTVNIIWRIVGGNKFSRSDEKFVMLLNCIDAIFQVPNWKLYFLSRFPNNRLVNYLLGSTEIHASVKNIRDYLMAFVDHKMELSKKKLEPDDFVEHFLLDMDKNKENEDLKHIYCKEQLVTVLNDLLVAGMSTTSHYLEFSLMYMILNPQVQTKVQEEIDAVVGKNVIPSYSDHRQNMPYTCATMMEIHRMGNIVSIIARRVPKNTVSQQEKQILNIMWSVRMDALFWGDPYTFRPERFLDANNDFIMENINRVMPFSAGARNCPGESVATASSFTFLAAILQKYKVSKAIQDEFIGVAKIVNIVSKTVQFHIHLEERL